MSQTLLIARREFGAYFRSPIGAVIVGAMLLILGIFFYADALTEKLLSAEVLAKFFYYASGVTAAGAVFLTFRLVAEERQTGTITLLNTSPISDRSIIAGKFLAAFGMLALAIVLTIYMPLLILVNGKVSWGHILVGYSGLLLLGAAITAIGLFASTITKSQVVAIIIAAAIIGVLYPLWWVARAVDPPLNTFLTGLAIHHENFRPFMLGTFQLDRALYYVAVTYFFLLAATRTLEARRWR